MRKLLLIIAMIPTICFSQKDSSKVKPIDTLAVLSGFYGTSGIIFSRMGRTYQEISDSLYVEVTIWQDSTIEIFGDTMRAIRLLLDQLKKRDSIEMELYSIMGAGVEFLNHVPDYWKDKKNNPKWQRYWALLKKQGYRETRKK